MKPPGQIAPHPPVSAMASPSVRARRQWRYDAISTGTGVLLALFMWGHMLFVSTILTGEKGFNWLAELLEDMWVAQPTVIIITVAFFVHFVVASRKIPAKSRERELIKQLGDDISTSQWNFTAEQRAALAKIRPHRETSLWIWQVRTGMVILAIGSIHLFVVAGDVIQRTLGGAGITAGESMARVQGGMWILYAILLFCVEVHAGVGLYRVAVKWGLGKKLPLLGIRLSRRGVYIAEQLVLWFFLGVGSVTLLVLAGVLPPPLAFLLR